MIKPILLRSQARSGSTYLMQFLSFFPDIVTTKVHPYEIRIAQYYAGCYETLSGLADHEHSSRPNFFHRDKGLKWIGTNPFNNNGKARYQRWIQEQYNPSLRDFFLETIENYYKNEAAAQNKEASLFFCEKSFYINRGPDFQDANVMETLQKDIINIFLVRDPLDILVSQIAFFRKNQNFSDKSIKQVVVNLARHMNNMVKDYYQKPSIVVRYEDLIYNPKTSLFDLAQMLGLEYDHDFFEQIIQDVSDNTEQKHITSKSSLDSIKRWERELSSEVISFSQQEMKEYIMAFQYS